MHDASGLYLVSGRACTIFANNNRGVTRGDGFSFVVRYSCQSLNRVGVIIEWNVFPED